MLISPDGGYSALGGALQKPFLQQVRFINVLNGLPLLRDGSCQGAEARGTTLELSYQSIQDLPVDLVQTDLVDSKQFKSSYTARFDGKWALVYQEELETRRESLKREKQLKSYRGRQFIKNLI